MMLRHCRNMKKLFKIPKSIADRHEQSCAEPIKQALLLISKGRCPRFRGNSSCSELSGVKTSSGIASYFKYLHKQFVQHRFLTAPAETLRELVVHWTPPPLDSEERKQVAKLLNVIFNYAAFRNGKSPKIQNGVFSWTNKRDGLCGFDLMSLHYQDVKCCPYCNAESIYAFRATEDQVVFSAFDHFYPKTTYPFLSLSLYNLIPVCNRCNSQIKGVADMRNIANPFIEDLHKNVIFFPVFQNLRQLLNSPCRISVCPRANCSPQARKFVSLFKIEQLYSATYSRDAWLCIERVRRYTPEFKRYMASVLHSNDPRLVEIFLFGMPLDESEINKTRLGKLTLDIVELFRR